MRPKRPTLNRSDWNQNGFENRTDSTITFTNLTNTFSIQPVVSTFSYWIAGLRYVSNGDTVVIDNTKEGMHAIYYDGATLTALANPTDANIDDVILNKALVSLIYWDVSASEAIYVGEERHGKSMSPETHHYLHDLAGLRYYEGLGLNTMSVDAAGATADAQFGVDTGGVKDEDIDHTISAVVSTTGLPIYHMTGAASDWNRTVVAGFSARTEDNTAGTRLAYNQFTGGAWQLTEVANNDFVLYHIFATTEKDIPIISVMGQADYLNATQARQGALTEIASLVLGDLPLPELRPIATVIYQTNLGYASAINGRIVSTDDGDDYVDWRDETISRSEVSTSSHSSLTGLGSDDHTQYLLADGTRALAGDWSAGDSRVTNVTNLGYSDTYANGNSTAAWTLTLSNGQLQSVTLNDNAVALTIVDTGNIGDGEWRITVTQDGVGGRAIASAAVAGGTIVTEGGAAPVFSAGIGDVDTLIIQKEGTVYRLKVVALDWLTW